MSAANDFYVTTWAEGNCGHAHPDVVSAYECARTPRPDLPPCDRSLAYIDPQGRWHQVEARRDGDGRLMFRVAP